jgi:hypothetical protein
MGCLSSKEAVPPAGGVKVGHLTAAQFAAREKHSRTTAVAAVPLPGGGSFTLRYAWSSVRGFYPDAPAKKNQDSVLVAPRFQGAASDHVFAVLDGHGETGDACAQFAAAKARLWQTRSLAAAAPAAESRASFPSTFSISCADSRHCSCPAPWLVRRHKPGPNQQPPSRQRTLT